MSMHGDQGSERRGEFRRLVTLLAAGHGAALLAFLNAALNNQNGGDWRVGAAVAFSIGLLFAFFALFANYRYDVGGGLWGLERDDLRTAINGAAAISMLTFLIGVWHALSAAL